MTRFVVTRLAQAMVSLLVAVSGIFVAVTVLPGDPVRALFGFTPPPPEIYAAIRNHFHLDEPLLRQWWLYLGDLLRGDLGRSYPIDPFGRPSAGRPVADVVRATAPVSAVVLLAALCVQLVAGLLLGALAAGRWGTRLDRLGAGSYALALLLVSTPVLVSAYVLRTVLAARLGWFPVSGVHEATGYVLPVLALSALSTGMVALLARAELRGALASPYLHAARGRGLPAGRLLGRHALRPALGPVVTFVAANVGQLAVGLVVVEGIFGVPGLGGALFEAIAARDRTLLVGLVTVVMAVVIVANAVADVLAALLDPRVRAASGEIP